MFPRRRTFTPVIALVDFGAEKLFRVHFYVGNARGPVSRFKREPRRIRADFLGEPHFKAFFLSPAAYGKSPFFAAL